jgi:cobalt-zinc-cadmium resistance protein CzcA
LVDGAVVMVEHLFHAEHARAGAGASTASSETPGERRAWMARELSFVARPTLFSGLTILLVYVPVLALTGVDGKMFRPMAIVVVLALATSIVLSLTYVPAAASLLVRLRDVPTRPPLLVRAIQRVYVPTLALAIRAPLAVALLAMAGLVAGGVAAARAGTELVPQLDEGDLVVQTTRAADTPLELAVDGALAFERAAKTVPEVRRVVSRIGSPSVATDIMGLEQADVFVGLAPRAAFRPGVDKERIIRELEEAVRRVDPELELSFTQPIQMRFNELLGGSVTDVAVSVYGPELSTLRALAERVAAAIEGVPGAVDVRVLAPPDVPELVITPSLASAAALELDARDVLDAVQALRLGLHAATTYDGPLPVPIVLRLPGARGAADVGRALVPNAAGGLVPLTAVATLERRDTPSMVQRQDGERRLMVGFNVRGGDLGTVVHEAERRVKAAAPMPQGYRLEWGGQIASLDAAKARLAVVVPVVLVAIAGLMYAAFRRVRPVVLLLLHVPSAVVGGVLALTAREMTLSISAAIGFIALSGIAVMNGMVMLTQVAEHERAGASPSEARLRAALDRARPVLMTALVAALGFVPMMLASGVGSEVQRPLATVVVGGLVTSTFTTLIVMPALYPWLAGKSPRRAERPADEGA